jgi:hypothetical protein
MNPLRPIAGKNLRLGFGACCFGLALAAAAATNLPLEIPLEWQSCDYYLGRLSLATRAGDSKERQQVKQPTNAATNLIITQMHLCQGTVWIGWDAPNRTLYVDQNLNLDLSDDPEGIFQGTTNAGQIVFSNAAFNLKNEAGRLRFQGDLFVYLSHNKSEPLAGYAKPRFLYQAQTEFGGQKYQVGIIPTDYEFPPARNYRGFLLLRSWADRQIPFRQNWWGVDTLPVPERLFIGGALYQAKILVEKKDAELGLTLRLTPQSAALGELNLVGQYLHRLVLKGDNNQLAVIIDNPTAKVKVPTAAYGYQVAWLKRETNEAVAYLQPFTLTAGKPHTLHAGGPLHNKVDITRRFGSLDLDYLLLGSGDVKYRSYHRTETAQPPQFTIQLNGRPIHQGQFEFG